MARELATLGGGCFWCVEAAFEAVDGVTEVTSGYAGGDVADPSYEAVCRGETGHAEVVQVAYDPEVLTYEDLLTVFFAIHDPTTEDREGPDVGSQYRSIVCYHDDDQRDRAEAVIDAISADYDDSIVTELVELDTFYEAEPYHQNYFANNPEDAYCQLHAAPKVEKVRESFGSLADAGAE